jgi:UDP-N-acetylmuramoyl-tripeptide--D-alanyl-D-alanine ligase
MAELGELEVPEHERLGELASAVVTRLVVVGERAFPIASGAGRAGLSSVQTIAGGEGFDAVVAALGDMAPGDVVLVKGSRVAGLERLAPRLETLLAGGSSAPPSDAARPS